LDDDIPGTPVVENTNRNDDEPNIQMAMAESEDDEVGSDSETVATDDADSYDEDLDAESENYSDNNQPTGSNVNNDSETIDSDFEANADEVITFIRIHHAMENYRRYSERVNFGRAPNRYGY
jgi:phosphatidate phosphatase PAH1